MAGTDFGLVWPKTTNSSDFKLDFFMWNRTQLPFKIIVTFSGDYLTRG